MIKKWFTFMLAVITVMSMQGCFNWSNNGGDLKISDTDGEIENIENVHMSVILTRTPNAKKSEYGSYQKPVRIVGTLPDGTKAYDTIIEDVYPHILAEAVLPDGGVVFAVVTEYRIVTESICDEPVEAEHRYKGALIYCDNEGNEKWRYLLTMNSDSVDTISVAPNGDIYTAGVYHDRTIWGEVYDDEGWQDIDREGGNINNLCIMRFNSSGDLLESKIIKSYDGSKFDMWGVWSLFTKGKFIVLANANYWQDHLPCMSAYDSELNLVWEAQVSFGLYQRRDILSYHNNRLLVRGEGSYAYFSLDGELISKYDMGCNYNGASYQDTVIIITDLWYSSADYNGKDDLILCRDGTEKLIKSYDREMNASVSRALDDGSFYVSYYDRELGELVVEYYDKDGNRLEFAMKLSNGAIIDKDCDFIYATWFGRWDF